MGLGWRVKVRGQLAFCPGMQGLGEAATAAAEQLCVGWMLSSVCWSRDTSPEKLLMLDEGMEWSD